MVVSASALKLDYAAVESEILRFIRRTVSGAGAKGVVVGLSGGVDSAVVGALCVKALGREKVVAMLMPSEHTPKEDMEDAVDLARAWGVRTFSVEISNVASALYSSIGMEGTRVAKGNAQARLRMALSYYVANTLGLLVAGTGDRSEGAMGFFCYDYATKVITVQGPKGIDELAKGDIVFSLNPLSRRIVEVPVRDVFRFSYDGKMVEFRSPSTDMLVTPNHRMLIQRSSSNPRAKLVFRSAEDCLGLRCTVTPLPSGWAGTALLPRTIDITFSQRHIRRTIKMAVEDAFYLFGLFIGDGCVVKGKVTVPVKSRLTWPEYITAHRDDVGRFVTITGEDTEPHMTTYNTHETNFALPGYTKPEARMRLVDILDKYGIGHSYTYNTVRIPSKGIHDFFAQFGIGARNKHIPSWVLQYPSEYLVHLLRGLKDSDGSHSDRQNVYYTASEKLKDDFVQLCFKLGRKASVRKRGARRRVIDGKTINTGLSYEICFQGRQRSQHIIDNRRARMVDYKGRVWCPSVPPYENVLVERNGKYVFSGNTKHGDGGVDFLPIAHLYKTQVRALGERLGVPMRVVTKPSSPRLWPGHLASDELPTDYNKLDLVLHCLFDRKMSPAKAAKEAGISRSVVDAVISRHAASAHKRSLPPTVGPV